MSADSKTPRTDAAVVSAEYIRREMDYYTYKFVLSSVAEELETELAAAKLMLENLEETCCKLAAANARIGHLEERLEVAQKWTEHWKTRSEDFQARARSAPMCWPITGSER